ncbi:MAG: bifunctional (p)ppGpp synthetase/guanosine-3',5'-bis(diphosphate) 3'-pyrophosphohydrolase [Propionibacteriaceae bacterium]|nr:bifunctional (p)ppGpp synthetase/guanosine-3',5'-bis(diphosphate) 3'-pyrophosphohydrolase [Propionibacteriaceae bacterium]
MTQDVYGPYGKGDGVPGEPRSRVAATDQPRVRMRQVLARLGAQRNQPDAVLEPLIRTIHAHSAKADVALIERAYRTAEHYHTGQLRKSGDAYITHPLAVATILAELGMNEVTLCAALLHDTVEDTSYTVEQLTADFGTEIAAMVDGVTKLDKIQYGESAKAETIRKMVLAMSKDIRVLVIKLADRLHNMRTIGYLRPDKQAAIARDTLEIFAPLAHRLGMNAIKWELEDLAFATLQPKVYDEIVRLVAARAPLREDYLRVVIDQVRADLNEAGIKATVYGRPKHYYSIYQKMVVRGRDFADIYDLVGLRILVATQRDCYAALGALHSRWKPLPGRFKDYIAMPKFNLYQSLHTTVLGPGGKPVELQIRTHEMHRQAEYGVAAHWKYKEGKAEGSDLAWVQQISQWQRETEDPGEFLDTLRFEIANDEVFVFTPKGDVVSLPADSTPVDFAYSVHTEVGHRTIGARVNGRLVPLESKLSSGDVVEVLISKALNAGPSRDWLHFVASPRARGKIRQYFTRERLEESIESGKDLLTKQLRRAGLPLQRLLTPEHMTGVVEHFRLRDVNALYAAIGEGNIGAQAVVQRLIESEGGAEEVAELGGEDTSVITRTQRSRGSGNEAGVVVQGDPNVWVKLARCCRPVPGDEIIGFVTRESGVSVHRSDCTNAQALRSQPERLVEVSWAPTADSYFLVALLAEGLDRPGILSEVTKLMGEHHISIQSATLNTTKDHKFKFRFTFETTDLLHLEHLINAIKKVPGVYDVYRLKN